MDPLIDRIKAAQDAAEELTKWAEHRIDSRFGSILLQVLSSERILFQQGPQNSSTAEVHYVLLDRKALKSLHEWLTNLLI